MDYNNNYDDLTSAPVFNQQNNDASLFEPIANWFQQYHQANLLPIDVNYTENTESIPYRPFIDLTTKIITTTLNYELDLEKNQRNNCLKEDSHIFLEASKSAQHILFFIGILNHIIIAMGIIFNTLNLYVLLKSKLNESPYSYLTILALSDLGTLLTVVIEKLRQQLNQTDFVAHVHLYLITILNIFQSCSMYITLALTIERFIFVHSPFKAMTICRKSIARRVCLIIFIFSILRYIYLPFMYNTNCSNGYAQKNNRIIDIFEFTISLGIPYTIIFIANISLIHSLNKQNNLMNIPISFSYNLSINSASSFNLNQISQQTTIQQSNQSKVSSPKQNIKTKFRFIKNSSRTATINENKPMLPTTNEEETEANSNEKVTSEKRSIARRSTISLKLIDETTAAQAVIAASSPTTNASNSVPKRMYFKKLKNSTTLSSFNKSTTSGGSLANGSSVYNKSNFLYHRTSNQRELRNQRKLTITLITILCLLLVCYLPSFMFEESLADVIFGTHQNANNDQSVQAYKAKLIGTRIAYLLMYLNCSCNFLIYCFCNKKFKNSLKILIKKSYFYNIFYVRFLTFMSKSCVSFYKKNKTEIKQHRHQLNRQNNIEMRTIVIDNSNLVNIASVGNKSKLSQIKQMLLFKKKKNNIITDENNSLALDKLV